MEQEVNPSFEQQAGRSILYSVYMQEYTDGLLLQNEPARLPALGA